ncbi:TRAP transporter small permease [Marinisporobacter balticus]|uniref:TRAP-type C4-dicarboxylate transport system permease small subunit n=1 Tax=Marinisporobacter balticus TaxID=2018667 RepID=A0A4R2LDI6_9FIRM|nr:TRAP transporter small permease subunit [Marinisporobacter balticus]TCO77415.1 TRAP-type C4-dicarboxylate transport system permease small subunit [Marinisporobacter balticus]
MIIKTIEKIQLRMGVVALSIFFLAILIQVFSRYAGISVIWTEEIANYSFIWAIFMGAAVMVNRKSHFRFNLLSQKIKGKKKIFLDITVDSILLIFNVFVSYYGIIATKSFWNYRWVAIQNFKMGYVWLCIPIMGITMAIYMMGHIIEGVKEMKGVE